MSGGIDRNPYTSRRMQNFQQGVTKVGGAETTLDELFNDNPFHTPHPDGPVNPVLYHGSKQEFEPFDIIRPRSKPVAHATESKRTAKNFKGDVSDAPGHLYEVEPLNQSTTWNQRMKYTGNEYHEETVAEEGFRVRRRLS